MKKAAIIEARMGSTRLPGKHMKKILGKPVLEFLIERLKQVSLLDEIVLATTKKKKDDVLVKLAKKTKIKSFRGSEDDVLGRVLGAAKSVKADVIVETLGDCPLLCPDIVSRCIKEFLKAGCDYLSNTLEHSYPRGLNVQVYPVKILEKIDQLTGDPLDREHVTLYIYNHPEKFKLKNVKATGELYWPELAITLDTAEDYELIKSIFENLYPKNQKFKGLDVVRFLRKHPEMLKVIKGVKRKVVVDHKEYEK